MPFKPPATDAEWASEIDSLRRHLRGRYLRYACGQDEGSLNDLVNRTWERARALLAKGRYHGQIHFQGWMQLVAAYVRREQITRFSRRASREVPYDDEVPRVEPPLTGPDPLRNERLWSAVARLPAQLRDIILDHLAEELSFPEISQHRGVPLSTVKRQHGQALALLKERISLEEQVPLHHEVRWIWDCLVECGQGNEGPDPDRALRYREALCLCVHAARQGIRSAERIAARVEEDPAYLWAAGRPFTVRQLKAFLREFGEFIHEIVKVLADPGPGR